MRKIKISKINILRGILIILLLVTFIRIFCFSNQNGTKSSGVSRKVTEIVTSNMKKVQNMPKNEKELFLEHTEKIIRKLAHFSIYTVVGLLMMSLMSTYKLMQNKRIWISLIVGVLYASSDEIHQYFVPGRSARVFDVMIDSAGVCLGICIVIFVLWIARKVMERKKKKNKEVTSDRM